MDAIALYFAADGDIWLGMVRILTAAMAVMLLSGFAARFFGGAR